nr:calreticulin [Bos taurus]
MCLNHFLLSLVLSIVLLFHFVFYICLHHIVTFLREETVFFSEQFLTLDLKYKASKLSSIREALSMSKVGIIENFCFSEISFLQESIKSHGRRTLVGCSPWGHEEQNIDCGGGYVNVFPAGLDQTDMHGDSEYNIMFGPDICGPGTKKVHVIFNYKGKNVLINKDIRCKDDEFTHLYTLIVRPNNTYEVKIDNSQVESGSLEDDWDFLPPKKIKDPDAAKPEDWDDRAKIDDPTDSKPEDWDKPEHIPDPDAKKPEDWDEEMDGEWEPPLIQNPEYKGEWKPRQIDNPEYKGIWIHPEIDNPEYSPDSNIYAYENFAVLGLDLWQVKSGTIFDNFLITNDEAYAEEFGNETWGVTKAAEKQMKDKQDEEQRLHEEEEEKKGKEEEEAEKDDDEDKDEDEEDEDEKEEEEEEDAAAAQAKDEL